MDLRRNHILLRESPPIVAAYASQLRISCIKHEWAVQDCSKANKQALHIKPQRKKALRMERIFKNLTRILREIQGLISTKQKQVAMKKNSRKPKESLLKVINMTAGIKNVIK